MSFSRAKSSRFNEAAASNLPKAAAESQPPIAKMNKAATGRVPRTVRVPPNNARNAPPKVLTPSRSLSQPSSSTVIGKQSPRPRSGGDEKNLSANKPKKLDKPTPSEEQLDEEKFVSATLLKTSADNENKLQEIGRETTDCDIITVTEAEMPLTSDADQKSNLPSSKVSSSGIPLRIKQQQMSTVPAISSTRRSPRIARFGVSSTTVRSRDGSLPKGGSDAQKTTSAAKRALETQFLTKKRRLDQLKKEICDRQKPLIDTYQTLIQLSKKLDDSGKTFQLEELKLIECKELTKLAPSEGGITEEISKDIMCKVDPSMIQNVQKTIKDVPALLLEMCRNLMNRRTALLETLEGVIRETTDVKVLQQNLNEIKKENDTLEREVREASAKVDKYVAELVVKWNALLRSSGDYASFLEQIEQLQQATSQKDNEILQLNIDIDEQRKKQKEIVVNSEHAITELKNKIRMLEEQIINERNCAKEVKDKSDGFEQKTKHLKIRLKDMETKQKEGETKYHDLLKSHRQIQEQMKANEHRWAKEKDEMQKKHNNDKQMLDKLTKDRSYFETRVKSLEEMVTETQNKCNTMEEKHKQELEEVRKTAAEDRAQRDSMQQKYDNVKDQLVQMEIRNKQAIDLVHSKNNFPSNETDSITTEREAELYTELLATRVALKAAEDQIQNYNREKLRFIDSIQSLQVEHERDPDQLAKIMVSNVEKISDLENKLNESKLLISNQKMEIASLKADNENLRQRPTATATLEIDGKQLSDGDLKLMLHEGRVKLEQSLKKSLDYERKIIRYEHDLSRQNEQILEMENLLKGRDGLISMMKAKKDELQMANDSLIKYANEIREYLAQVQEEARTRTELVQELSTNLNSQGHVRQQLEKKVKELEGSLSITNEKRFILQNTISAMEKELQSTKAQANMPFDIPTRYDSALISHTLNTTQKYYRPTKTDVKSKSTAKANTLDKILEDDEIPKNNEVKMWVDYYNKKLKYLKRSFKSVSNTIFQNDIKMHSMTQTNITYTNKYCKNNYPLKVARSCMASSMRKSLQSSEAWGLIALAAKKAKAKKLKNQPKRDNPEQAGCENSAQNLTNKSVNVIKPVTVPQINKAKASANAEGTTLKNTVKITETAGNNGDKNMQVMIKHKKPFILSTRNQEKQITQPLQDITQSNKQTVPKAVASSIEPTDKLKQLAKPVPSHFQKKSHSTKTLSRSGSESSTMCKNRINFFTQNKEPHMSRDLEQERTNFINHAHNISYHLTKNKKSTDVSKHKVSVGSVICHKPTTDVRSVLISHDLMARSLSKISANVNSSINLLSNVYSDTKRRPHSSGPHS